MDQTTDTSLTIVRNFPIPIEEMWKLWTDSDKISQWHRPNMTDFVTEAEADARVGGKYRIAMKHHGAMDTVTGEFMEVDEPKRLVYSWQWEGDPSGDLSEVSIELEAMPEGTKLTLIHTRLSGPQSVKAHGEGWLGCLENINVLIKV